MSRLREAATTGLRRILTRSSLGRPRDRRAGPLRLLSTSPSTAWKQGQLRWWVVGERRRSPPPWRREGAAPCRPRAPASSASSPPLWCAPPRGIFRRCRPAEHVHHRLSPSLSRGTWVPSTTRLLASTPANEKGKPLHQHDTLRTVLSSCATSIGEGAGAASAVAHPCGHRFRSREME
jgi:hypothetical protein